MPATPAQPDLLCGHCRYNVRGLPTTICPECGSDFRNVGMLKGGGGVGWSLRKWLIVWGAVALLVFLTPLEWASSTWGLNSWRRSSSIDLSLGASRASTRSSFSVHVDSGIEGRSWGGRPMVIERSWVLIKFDSLRPQFELTGVGGEVRAEILDSGNVSIPCQPDLSGLELLFVRTYGKSPPPEILKVLEFLQPQFLDSAATGALFNPSTFPRPSTLPTSDSLSCSGTYTLANPQPSDWNELFKTLALIAIWAAGIPLVRYLRTRRHERRRFYQVFPMR